MATSEKRIQDDERTFVRVQFETSVHCASDDGHVGAGITGDVSRGGLSLHLGRYLRPGRLVLLRVSEPAAAAPLELKGEIAWCRPEGPAGAFRAGVRVIHDEPEAIEGLSRLVHAAVLPSICWTAEPPAILVPEAAQGGWQAPATRAFAATA